MEGLSASSDATDTLKKALYAPSVVPEWQRFAIQAAW